MASVATSNITQVAFATPLLSFDGCPVEIWRIASGASPADTAVITPSHMKLIKAVIGPGQANTGSTGSTSVTFTIGGNGSTATVGQIDVMLLGFPR